MTDPSLPSAVHPFDWVDDVIFILDSECRFIFVNTFTLRSWDKRLHELLGHTFEETVPERATQNVKDAFRHALETQERTEFDTFGVHHQAWFNVTLYPHHGSLIVQVRRLPRHGALAVPADYDALTGCLTRAAFQKTLPTLPLPNVLAIIDLNVLKSVNTLHGHSGGDAHIRTVAHGLREALPAGALLCRWGGDEFVVVTPGDDQGALQHLLDQTNETLPRPAPDTLAFTAGMAQWERGAPYERAFAVADEQLQLHKEQLREATPGAWEADAFVTFSRELEALNDPSDLIQHALDRLMTLLDFDQAAYAVIEEHETFFSHQAHREGVAVPEPALYVRLPLEEPGMLHTVQHTQRTVWSTDYQSAPFTLPLVVNQGVKSGVVTPVFSQGQVIAALVLRTVNRWQTITPQMRRVVELTALRLEHALELRRAVGEIRSTLDVGLQTLGVVLEARDIQTRGHMQRAAVMAASLGESLGLSGSDLGHLRQGAYLHDLGKLCVADEILGKPGRLSPEEWTIMQGHVQQGYDLATRIPGLPQGILNVIRSHHERWDGSGYPDGLSGREIPREARIFAVCDVYDALISDRPYKAAWKREDAVTEIAGLAGHHFDPEVVRAFLTLMGRTGAEGNAPGGTRSARTQETRT